MAGDLNSCSSYFFTAVQLRLITFFVLLHIDRVVMTPEEIVLCDGGWTDNWTISRIVAVCTLCLLTLWELMQLTSKVVNGQFGEFFGWQNMIEGLMISLTFAFFIVEYKEYCPLHNSSKSFYHNIVFTPL